MHQDGFLHEYADLFSALVCHAFRLEQELVEAAYRGHSFRRAAEGFRQYDEREAQRVEEGEDDECELGAEAVDAGNVRSKDDERDDWRRPEDEAEVQRLDEACLMHQPHLLLAHRRHLLGERPLPHVELDELDREQDLVHA